MEVSETIERRSVGRFTDGLVLQPLITDMWPKDTSSPLMNIRYDAITMAPDHDNLEREIHRSHKLSLLTLVGFVTPQRLES